MRKFQVIFFFFSVLIMYILNNYLGKNETSSYLYMGSTNFDHHDIKKSDLNSKKIIFLGSSSVSGSNIPRNSTISDYYNQISSESYSYNLGVLQGTILDSLIYLKMALIFRPTVVVLGVNPSSFPRVLSGPLVWSHTKIVSEYIPDDLNQIIEFDKNKKADLSYYLRNFLPPKNIPSNSLLVFREKIEALRDTFFGNVYEKKFLGAEGQFINEVLASDNLSIYLIRAIGDLCKKNNIKLFVYLEPIWNPNDVYGESDFQKYKNKITNLLNDEKIAFFDYTNLISSDNANFMDFIHLRPASYKKIAAKIYEDVKGKI